jgi:hypothetical protein
MTLPLPGDVTSHSAARRDRYWWLWPNFHEADDARDGAKMGVTACGLIGFVTAITFYFRHLQGQSDPFDLIGGLIMLIVYCALGYGILRMSRMAASGALVLFAADKVYSAAVNGASLGIALVLVWYLIQANRAIYWFRRQTTLSTADGAALRKCGNCGAEYDPADHRADASVSLCSRCRSTSEP